MSASQIFASVKFLTRLWIVTSYLFWGFKQSVSIHIVHYLFLVPQFFYYTIFSWELGPKEQLLLLLKSCCQCFFPLGLHSSEAKSKWENWPLASRSNIPGQFILGGEKNSKVLSYLYSPTFPFPFHLPWRRHPGDNTSVRTYICP